MKGFFVDNLCGWQTCFGTNLFTHLSSEAVSVTSFSILNTVWFPWREHQDIDFVTKFHVWCWGSKGMFLEDHVQWLSFISVNAMKIKVGKLYCVRIQASFHIYVFTCMHAPMCGSACLGFSFWTAAHLPGTKQDASNTQRRDPKLTNDHPKNIETVVRTERWSFVRR